MAKTTEAKVKDKVVAILKEVGAWYCFPVASGYGRSGIPDILVCWDGYFYAIECKADGRVTAALQDRELDRIRKAGGVALVINELNVRALKVIFQS